MGAALALVREPHSGSGRRAARAPEAPSHRRRGDPHAGGSGGAHRPLRATPRTCWRVAWSWRPASRPRATTTRWCCTGRTSPRPRWRRWSGCSPTSRATRAIAISRPRFSAASANTRRPSSSIESVLAEYPNQAKVWMSLGHALKTAGRNAESIEAYRKSIELAPNLGEAYWSLANLKTFRFTPRADAGDARAARGHATLAPTIASTSNSRWARRSKMPANTRSPSRTTLEGNRLRRADDPLRRRRERGARRSVRRSSSRASSSRSAPAGAARRRIRSSWWACRARARRSSSRSWPATRRSKAPWSCPTSRCSRAWSGSRTTRASRQRVSARARRSSPPRNCAALGERYLAQTRIQRKTAAPFFIDKMPNNFAHVGLHPPDAAEREDHRCAPASARLLLLGIQAALRARPELHLRPRRDRPLLPRLRRAHGAFRRGAAGPRAPRVLREHGRGHRGRGAPAARVLRPAVRGGSACASTKTSAPCAPRARNRFASRFSARAWITGGTTSPGSRPSRRRWARCFERIQPRRSFDSVAKGIHSPHGAGTDCRSSHSTEQ